MLYLVNKKEEDLGENHRMQGIAVMTDSNSGMSREEGERLGISVLPMPFLIDGTFHLEGVDLTQEEFYRLLGQNAEVSTSQPSPGRSSASPEYHGAAQQNTNCLFHPFHFPLLSLT